MSVETVVLQVVSALSSTVWNILLSKVLHADVLSGSDCFVRQGFVRVTAMGTFFNCCIIEPCIFCLCVVTFDAIGSGLTCEYDNNVEYEDTSSAYAACNANVDCNGVLEVPNADPSAAPAYHVCESEFSSNPETTYVACCMAAAVCEAMWPHTWHVSKCSSVAHKSFCRSPPWKTGCDQSESQISAFPVGLVRDNLPF